MPAMSKFYSEHLVKETLREHYICSIQCLGMTHQDQAICSCAKWYAAPQKNIGEAVERWIEHFIEQMDKVQ